VTITGVGRQAVCAGEGADLRSLVEAAQASDPDAWEALYRRAYPRLVAYATRRLDPERAQDAVAETMARAVAGIGRFEWNGSGIDGWLFGILRHVVLDAHRARARQIRAPHAETQTPDPGPLERVLNDEETTAVRAAFAQLRAADRELLELRVMAGLSSEEVAAVLGKRPGAIRTAQARALQRLRRNLQRQP
jgi:RNA polymerase sigma-70 factor (ECF subfamily)